MHALHIRLIELNNLHAKDLWRPFILYAIVRPTALAV